PPPPPPPPAPPPPRPFPPSPAPLGSVAQPLSIMDDLVQNFPFAACAARNITLSSYRLGPSLGPTSVSRTENRYCFWVKRTGYVDPKSACMNMTVNKVDIIVNRACVEESPRPVRAATVNGVPLAIYFSPRVYKGESYSTLAISRISDVFPKFPPGGLEVCLELRISSLCSQPETLCYGGRCVYALFNEDRTCCPTSQMPVA
ncbi:hypothetical protein Vretimale_7485, partial [Volvox reticuliferus]